MFPLSKMFIFNEFLNSNLNIKILLTVEKDARTRRTHETIRGLHEPPANSQRSLKL